MENNGILNLLMHIKNHQDFYCIADDVVRSKLFERIKSSLSRPDDIKSTQMKALLQEVILIRKLLNTRSKQGENNE